MAKPSSTDIEALYTTAEAAGMTREEADAVATPHIHTMTPARRLSDVRSHGELRAITAALHAEIARRTPPTPAGATDRQVEYAAALGGDATGMTRAQASALIDSLKAQAVTLGTPADRADRAARRVAARAARQARIWGDA